MPGVELALAIIATTDLCLKYGSELVHLCAAFKHANTEVAQRILRVKASWVRTSYHLGVLRNIAQILPIEYLELQEQTLKVLQEKLQTAVTTLESLAGKPLATAILQDQIEPLGRLKSAKYVLLEGRLKKIIDELETWQGIFDPSWYLIIKAAIPQIDEELARYNRGPGRAVVLPSFALRSSLVSPLQDNVSVWLKEDAMISLDIIAIPFCSAKVALRSDGSRPLILESISSPITPASTEFVRQIRDLARKLSHADPITFGLLKCKGVVRQEKLSQPPLFTFVFALSDGLSEPTTLRSMFLSRSADHSLSDRFVIACELAKSVCYVHTFGFVHKNIRPENILMLKGSEAPIGHAYLVGFEYFRAAEGNTSRLGDSAWERNLYRHPRRQGKRPKEDYIMQHDIYSLGICLLELGLWESFVEYDVPGKNPRPSAAIQLPSDSPGLNDPYLLKEHLLSITRSQLPRRMGTKYTHVVETCLTCLDSDNTDFGDETEFQDADGILVGVRYIQKILMQLNTISV